MSVEIGAEYASSLADLTVNSKPLINMLTILAEENQEHAGVIVSAVETHLEKVRPEIKLPVLYLVDSIIKNVGGAYTQKFSQIIVNMFTKTFKQVDEKTRSQMFKLRETWNDVFPANKLYQLDVKVSLIDPAWPIQAQVPLKQGAAAPAPVIHLNPHFQKKVVPPTPAPTAAAAEKEEDMMSVLARKQQELLLLQRKKIEMQLEATRRQLSQKNDVPVVTPAAVPAAPAPEPAPVAKIPVQQRLGPPVTQRNVSPGGARIAPVSGAMLAGAVRRADPRLARLQPSPAAPSPPHAPSTQSASDIFDIKPLDRSERVIKRKNAITIDVQTKNEPRRERDPRYRDPRLKRRQRDSERRNDGLESDSKNHNKKINSNSIRSVDSFPVVDPKKVNKLPPIPKLSKTKASPTPEPTEDNSDSSLSKRKKDTSESPRRTKKSRRRDGKESPASPEKSSRNGPRNYKQPREVKPAVEPSETPAEADVESAEPEVRSTEQEVQPEEPAAAESKMEDEPVTFKELRNSTKERNYMRRNREKSDSPEPAQPVAPTPVSEPPTVPDILMDENKDVDLRVLVKPPAEPAPAPVTRKRPSTDSDTKSTKKNKMEKFDILFGNEDVDLRTLPQVEDAPAPPTISKEVEKETIPDSPASPDSSPKRRKSWAKVKDPKKSPEEAKSQLEIVRAKLAEATKGKDRLGRPLLYIKDDNTQIRRRTISSSEDTDMRYAGADLDADNDGASIKIIMSQAEEQLKGGNLNLEQFNHLVMQVLQLNERQKLKEAKQRESLEVSKRKLQKLSSIPSDDEPDTPAKDVVTPFGDIDERVLPPRLDRLPENTNNVSPNHGMPASSDFDLRVPPIDQYSDRLLPPYPPPRGILPPPLMMRGGYPSRPLLRPHGDDFGGPRMRDRMRIPIPPFFRGRMPYERAMRPRMPPPPIHGISQGECPLLPYVRSTSPPPLGTVDIEIPPTNFALVDYIDRDPMKTIDIDGIPREIRFYGRTAIVMLDWDDPREISFLPGRRRITFDGKDSFVLGFNEDDIMLNVDGQYMKIGYGRPTRELYVDDKWYECFFGGPPIGIIVDDKVKVIHLAGPPPQVDIGKVKRNDYVAGKINIIVDAVTMCPVFLDAKLQKVEFEGQVITIRFVDSLKTVLINEKPFKVEYGGLPKPIIINNNKHFIRFSVLPRNVRPGHINITNMEGATPTAFSQPLLPTPVLEEDDGFHSQDHREEESSDQGGLDMLASLMPSSMAPASQFSGYSVAEPLKPSNPGQIPGLETPTEENPPSTVGLPFFGSINVNDLFAKLVATGIVQPSAAEKKEKEKEKKEKEKKEEEKKEEKKPAEKPHTKEKEKRITKVDLMKPETLRVKQSGIVALLYSGMQCSGCGARFPPEQTVRYSQHLDWHFRQNRRERDSARRAHSRNWHYDLCDWIQYEEIEDLEEREKSWFESQGADAEGGAETPSATGAEHEALSVAAGAPADASCALCGDKFDQFYNQDKEEWHLRKATRHEDKNYHPLCYEDYKASLTKAETAPDDSVIEIASAEAPQKEKREDPADPDVQEVIPSDDEGSVVEVLENETLSQDGEQSAPMVVEDEPAAATQVESDGEDDDVVLKQEPLVQVDVEDDDDTDDETTAARAQRDHLFNLASVRIKQEPVDPDDEPVVTAETEAEPVPRIETTHAAVTSSIDGNVQLETTSSGPTLPTGGIRINITKPPPVAPPSPPSEDSHVAEDCDEPLPPGEEPPIEYKLKPTLDNVEFSRQPPVERGIELSGLCSIM